MDGDTWRRSVSRKQSPSRNTLSDAAGIDRRAFLKANLALSAGLMTRPATAAAAPAADTKVWTFDDLRAIGGHAVECVGAPTLVPSPWGQAVAFDGERDGLLIGAHPLAGATTFTFEAIFRPDGGAFEQRWFHLESDEIPPVAPGKGSTRMLFEIRVTDRHWYLDAFMTGPGYRQAMMAPARLFPTGRWYHVAQTFDGHTYRAFVDGALQMSVTGLAFSPQGPGRAAIGMRMNRVAYFRGAVRQARFTPRALPASAFLSARSV